MIWRYSNSRGLAVICICHLRCLLLSTLEERWDQADRQVIQTNRSGYCPLRGELPSAALSSPKSVPRFGDRVGGCFMWFHSSLDLEGDSSSADNALLHSSTRPRTAVSSILHSSGHRHAHDSDDTEASSRSSDEDSGAGEEEEEEPQRNQFSNKGAIMLGGIFILLMLALGGYMYITKSSSNSASSSSTPSNTQSLSQSSLTSPADGPSSQSDPSNTAPEISSQTQTSDSFSNASTATSTASAASSTAFGTGLAGVSDPTCGASGATDTPGMGTGPNGAESWLNCGISKENPDSPWTPPTVTIDQLKAVDIEDAFKLDLFSACTSYLQFFKNTGEKTGIPPMLLVSVAMTESSCNPNAGGDNGDAHGLMQLLTDECEGKDATACTDPEWNIGKGAAELQTLLSDNNGSVLLSLGNYNGWYAGLTYNNATAAATSDCCNCQNNLDYFQNILNGFLQGVDGYSIGTINNLAPCPNE